MNFKVDKAVFDMFEGLVIGIIDAKNLDNKQDAEKAASFLNEQVESVRNEWSYERLESDQRINAWREAYRSFKAKPKKYKCSIENMYRMILDGIQFPSINKAVDVYNAISLKYNIPAGGDDIDKVEGDIFLTFANGDERFIPLNAADSIPPKPGEVVYRDDKDVLCRRWNWRECEKTKMTAESENICLVVEGLPPVSADEVNKVSAELAGQIKRFCGGLIKVSLVDRSTPVIGI